MMTYENTEVTKNGKIFYDPGNKFKKKCWKEGSRMRRIFSSPKIKQMWETAAAQVPIDSVESFFRETSSKSWKSKTKPLMKN